MGFLSDIFKWPWKILGLAHQYGGPFLFSGVCFILSVCCSLLAYFGPIANSKLTADNWFRQAGENLLVVMLPLACLLVLLTIVSFLFAVLDRIRSPRIHLIAWDGYGEARILKLFPFGCRLRVLEYLRGLRRTESYRIDGRRFDAIISDIESIQDHHLETYLRTVEPDDLNTLDPAFRSKLKSLNDRRGQPLAIPIRWGVNDILYNAVKAKAFFGKNLPDLTAYSGFKLEDLIAAGKPGSIGLWNWYLPTVQFLLLANALKPKPAEVHCESMDNVYRILKKIRDNAELFVLFDTTEEIRKALIHETEGPWTVLGAGSWALGHEQNELGKSLRAVIPKSGATCWVECLAFLEKGRAGYKSRRLLCQAFHSLPIQNALTECVAYTGAPVTSKAIECLMRDKSTLTPYAEHLTAGSARVLDTSHVDGNNLVIRQKPTDAHLWEYEWERTVGTIRDLDS